MVIIFVSKVYLVVLENQEIIEVFFSFNYTLKK